MNDERFTIDGLTLNRTLCELSNIIGVGMVNTIIEEWHEAGISFDPEKEYTDNEIQMLFSLTLGDDGAKALLTWIKSQSIR